MNGLCSHGKRKERVISWTAKRLSNPIESEGPYELENREIE